MATIAGSDLVALRSAGIAAKVGSSGDSKFCQLRQCSSVSVGSGQVRPCVRLQCRSKSSLASSGNGNFLLHVVLSLLLLLSLFKFCSF